MKKYLLLLLVASSFTQAATFNVSTTAELRAALSTAATNGEDDTINLADGTYKTTDDAEGTFTYISNETNSLTLQGSHADNVILSGDLTNQVLKTNSIGPAVMKLESLTIRDGNSLDGGGGLATLFEIEILNSRFINNQAVNGGGALTVGNTAEILNSEFINNRSIGINTSTGGRGGALIAGSDLKIADSLFEGNSANVAGGGIYNVSPAIRLIERTSFISNSAPSGGGFYCGNGSVTVKNSTFERNVATERDGGGLLGCSANIYDSSFSSNSAARLGGAVTSANEVINSTFISNEAVVVGGAISSSSTVKNSFFKSNYAPRGAAIASAKNISNSIFIENGKDSDKHTIEGTNLTMTNSLLIGNTGGVKMGGKTNVIINSIFQNAGLEINFYEDGILGVLENNYIDINKTSGAIFSKNNIYSGIELGFVDEMNGDYRLTPSSDLIDAGIINIDGIVFPETDLDGNSRISGGAIDIGPYEYLLTLPTISLSYSGEPQEQTKLTFLVDYTLSDGRSIQSVEYDYLDNGVYTSSDTYTYSTSGTYTVKVKVTDDSGEFSTSSIDVVIQELPFSEMTYEQKLIKAISPEYYDLLISEIDIEKSESFSSGKQYVQNNLSEFSLVTEATQATAVTASNTSGIATGKQYVQNNLTEFSLVTEAAFNANSDLDGDGYTNEYEVDFCSNPFDSQSVPKRRGLSPVILKAAIDAKASSQ
jgi:predicted outer membrane repeat protein